MLRDIALKSKSSKQQKLKKKKLFHRELCCVFWLKLWFAFHILELHIRFLIIEWKIGMTTDY